MTYNYHGVNHKQTGHLSPLYGPEPNQNVNAAINAWINAGASASKMLLGLAFYGLVYRLSNPESYDVGAPVSGAGNPGRYTNDTGKLTYLEICDEFRSDGWVHYFDNQRKVAYAVKGDQWIGYDNIESIKLKSQFAIDKQLSGVSVN